MRTNPSPHDGEALLELSKANAALREQVVYLQEDRITALKRVAQLEEALERIAEIDCGSRSAAFEAKDIARQALQEQSES